MTQQKDCAQPSIGAAGSGRPDGAHPVLAGEPVAVLLDDGEGGVECQWTVDPTTLPPLTKLYASPTSAASTAPAELLRAVAELIHHIEGAGCQSYFSPSGRRFKDSNEWARFYVAGKDALASPAARQHRGEAVTSQELAELDLAVAKAEGMATPYLGRHPNGTPACFISAPECHCYYRPTLNGAVAMLLLEKYRLSLWNADEWLAGPGVVAAGHGPTPAIAISRAVVALRSRLSAPCGGGPKDGGGE